MINDTSPISSDCSRTALAVTLVPISIWSVRWNPSELFSGFNNKTFGTLFMSGVSKCSSVVVFGVCGLISKFKILYSVIKGIVVNVMNHFSLYKPSSNRFFHNKLVFIHLSTVYSKFLISVGSNATRAIGCFSKFINVPVSSKSAVMHTAITKAKSFLFTPINYAHVHFGSSNRHTIAQIQGLYQ